MIEAVASIIGLAIFYPEVRSIVYGAGMIAFSNVMRLVAKGKTAKEVYDSGLVDMNFVKEFIRMKSRNICSYYFENPKLTNHGKYFELRFYSGSTEYAMRFPKKRGIINIKHVEDQDGNDVTDEILKFMGPGNNFYDIPTTPELLGYDSLHIRYRSGKTKKYGGRDQILL